MDFSHAKAITIPEGSVKRILSGTTVLWKKTRVPDEYQEVEYLESTGTQYIRTGVYPTDRTRMEMLYYTTCTGSFYASGARKSTGGTIYFAQTGATSGNKVSATVNGTSAITGWSRAATGQTYNILLETLGNGTYIYTIDDLTNERSYTATKGYTPMGICEYPIMIFALAYTYVCSDTNRLYKYKLYQDSNLVRDFVPCYHKSDSVAGLYDVVNDVFYTNAGTGTFTVGSDI